VPQSRLGGLPAASRTASPPAALGRRTVRANPRRPRPVDRDDVRFALASTFNSLSRAALSAGSGRPCHPLSSRWRSRTPDHTAHQPASFDRGLAPAWLTSTRRAPPPPRFATAVVGHASRRHRRPSPSPSRRSRPGQRTTVVSWRAAPPAPAPAGPGRTATGLGGRETTTKRSSAMPPTSTPVTPSRRWRQAATSATDTRSWQQAAMARCSTSASACAPRWWTPAPRSPGRRR
jgi:hypothetical protein